MPPDAVGPFLGTKKGVRPHIRLENKAIAENGAVTRATQMSGRESGNVNAAAVPIVNLLL